MQETNTEQNPTHITGASNCSETPNWDQIMLGIMENPSRPDPHNKTTTIATTTTSDTAVLLRTITTSSSDMDYVAQPIRTMTSSNDTFNVKTPNHNLVQSMTAEGSLNNHTFHVRTPNHDVVQPGTVEESQSLFSHHGIYTAVKTEATIDIAHLLPDPTDKCNETKTFDGWYNGDDICRFSAVQHR